MMKGEPLALITIINGLFWFLIVQLLGIFYTGAFYTPPTNIAQMHFSSVFLGWIGFVVLGAEMQMSRAFTALRRFDPEYLRWIFLLSLNIGLGLVVIGSYQRSQTYVISGLILYLLGALIQLWWLTRQRFSKHFKFPLGYHILSQYFFITGLFVLIFNSFIGFHGLIQQRANAAILFTVGWIFLVLSGTMIRILPMFIGKVIDREVRQSLSKHLIFSFLSAIILSIGLLLYTTFFLITAILWIGILLWLTSWIWTLVILFRSLYYSKRKSINRVTLLYFVPGILSLTIGLIFGIVMPFNIGDAVVNRRLHIHLTLLAGLSMIILGAIHRVTSFQIHTILYSGKKEEGPGISRFLKNRYFAIIAIFLIISQIILVTSIVMQSTWLFGLGGLLHLAFATMFVLLILSNYFIYLREVKEAIPFDKKASEV